MGPVVESRYHSRDVPGSVTKVLLTVLLMSLSLYVVESIDPVLKIVPETDIFHLVGSNLVIICSLDLGPAGDAANERLPSNQTGIMTTQPYNVSLLTMRRNGTLLNVTYDSRHLSIKFQQSNVQQNHSGIYACHYGNSSSLYDMRLVSIGEPPPIPDKLQCVSLNLEDLTCSVLDPKSKMPVHWSMEYRCDGGVYKRNCSRTPSHEERLQCGVLKNDVGFIECDVTVFAENAWYRLNISKTFHVNINDSIVKPNPVRNASYSELSSRAVKLSLVLNSICALSHPEFKIEVNSAEGWDRRRLIEQLNITKQNVSGNPYARVAVFKLDSLVPFTHYNVSTSCKPCVAKGDVYWSNPTSVTFRTREDVPCAPTRLTVGSFVLQDCNATRLCVVLYWKNPQKRCSHGIITGYKVAVQALQHVEPTSSNPHIDRDAGVSKRSPDAVSTLPDTVVSTAETHNPGVVYTVRHGEVVRYDKVQGYTVYSALETPLLKDAAYMLAMKPKTRVGYSYDKSTVIVPEWSQGRDLRVEWLAVEIIQHRARISWSIPDRICSNITSITFYWCLENIKNSSTKYIRCKENLDWFTPDHLDVCGEGRYYWMDVTNQSVVYAVSIATGQISGGMVWEQYRFKNFYTAPEQPLYSVNTDLKNSTLMNVTMTYRKVSVGGRPLLHQLVYKETIHSTDKCPTDGQKKNFSVDFTDPVLVVGHLKPGTQYVVCVRSINSRSGLFGKPLMVVTAPVHAESDDTVWIVPVAVLSSIALIVLVGVMIRCLRRYKKTMTIDIADALPDMKPEEWKIDCEEDELAEEKDSGNYSGNGRTDGDWEMQPLQKADTLDNEDAVSGYVDVRSVSVGEDSDSDGIISGEFNDGFEIQTMSNALEVDSRGPGATPTAGPHPDLTGSPDTQSGRGQQYVPDSAANSPPAAHHHHGKQNSRNSSATGSSVSVCIEENPRTCNGMFGEGTAGSNNNLHQTSTPCQEAAGIITITESQLVGPSVPNLHRDGKIPCVVNVSHEVGVSIRNPHSNISGSVIKDKVLNDLDVIPSVGYDSGLHSMDGSDDHQHDGKVKGQGSDGVIGQDNGALGRSEETGAVTADFDTLQGDHDTAADHVDRFDDGDIFSEDFDRDFERCLRDCHDDDFNCRLDEYQNPDQMSMGRSSLASDSISRRSFKADTNSVLSCNASINGSIHETDIENKIIDKSLKIQDVCKAMNGFAKNCQSTILPDNTNAHTSESIDTGQSTVANTKFILPETDSNDTDVTRTTDHSSGSLGMTANHSSGSFGMTANHSSGSLGMTANHSSGSLGMIVDHSSDSLAYRSGGSHGTSVGSYVMAEGCQHKQDQDTSDVIEYCTAGMKTIPGYTDNQNNVKVANSSLNGDSGLQDDLNIHQADTVRL